MLHLLQFCEVFDLVQKTQQFQFIPGSSQPVDQNNIKICSWFTDACWCSKNPEKQVSLYQNKPNFGFTSSKKYW